MPNIAPAVFCRSPDVTVTSLSAFNCRLRILTARFLLSSVVFLRHRFKILTLTHNRFKRNPWNCLWYKIFWTYSFAVRLDVEMVASNNCSLMIVSCDFKCLKHDQIPRHVNPAWNLLKLLLLFNLISALWGRMKCMDCIRDTIIKTKSRLNVSRCFELVGIVLLCFYIKELHQVT